MKTLLLGTLLASVLWGQKDVEFRGRRAWRLENDRLRVTVLKGGGHVAELVLKNPPGGREVNPLWIPPWPSIEPSTYSKEKYGSVYGTDSEAATLAGIMGHNVCFDYWGAPSEAEFRAGLSFHGEVSNLAWYDVGSRESAGSLAFTYRVDLPESRTALTRTLRLKPGEPVLYFEETAENKTAFDRPFGWVEHVTFGPPFVDPKSAFFDASATQGERGSGDQRREGRWPQVSERDFRRFSQEPRSADMAYFLLDPSREVEFISALNTEYRQLVAYMFKRRDFPWLNLWEQNRDRMHLPWKGEAQTRGMEFGNTRAGSTARSYFRMPELWGTPTFGWLDAKAKLTARYLAVMVPVPDGFDGVRDIRLEGREIVIEPSRGGTAIRVPFDPSLF
ncbi:MAG: hypothetical protein HY236_17320 [Acidobacteria bacterium]|nr:hypothetical protein [Acidobacteriota bacterium]